MWTLLGAAIAAILTAMLARGWKNRDGTGLAVLAALAAIVTGFMTNASATLTTDMPQDGAYHIALALMSAGVGTAIGWFFVALHSPKAATPPVEPKAPPEARPDPAPRPQMRETPGPTARSGRYDPSADRIEPRID